MATPPGERAGRRVFAYDASVDRMVVGGGWAARKPTWLLDIRTGSRSRSRAGTPVVERNRALPTTASPAGSWRRASRCPLPSTCARFPQREGPERARRQPEHVPFGSIRVDRLHELIPERVTGVATRNVPEMSRAGLEECLRHPTAHDFRRALDCDGGLHETRLRPVIRAITPLLMDDLLHALDVPGTEMQSRSVVSDSASDSRQD